MRATVIYGAGDIRVENVPDAALREPTDAIIRVVSACVCGSDLWPYAKRPATETPDRRSRCSRCSSGHDPRRQRPGGRRPPGALLATTYERHDDA